MRGRDVSVNLTAGTKQNGDVAYVGRARDSYPRRTRIVTERHHQTIRVDSTAFANGA